MRIRVELIAAVYDKALRQKDFFGLVDKDRAREAAERKAELQATSLKATQTNAQKQAQKANTEKAEDPGAGVDTGKIVNLMAGDQTRVSTIVSRGYTIYGAPIEIVVGRARFCMSCLGACCVSFFPRTPWVWKGC
jgi:high-affinity K+ transport system ATPase subunit B